MISTVIIIDIVVLILSIVIHELAHGWVANLLGDPTAKQEGRLTLNPIKHLDPLGSIIIPATLVFFNSPALFGWAKPVPVNTMNFKNPEKDMALVAIAGPISNLLIVIVAMVFLAITSFKNNSLTSILISCIIINIVLAVFNMIPVPPLDGSRILRVFVPQKVKYILDRIEPYGIVIIFVMIYFNMFDQIIKRCLMITDYILRNWIYSLSKVLSDVTMNFDTSFLVKNTIS